MPVVSLVCPHCEDPVQIQVTAVTRSRPCPRCNNLLLLQVSEKSSGATRKALLVAPTPPPDVQGDRDGSEPQILSGEVFDRMCVDPSVQRLRKRLFMGSAMVAGLVLLLTGFQLAGWFRPAKAPAASASATGGGKEAALPASVPQVVPIVAARSADHLVPIAGSQFMALASLGEPREVLQKFLEATTVEQRLDCVAGRDEVEPLMREYYTRHPEGPQSFDRIQALAGSDKGVLQFHVQFKEGPPRTATLLKMPGGYRLDWPSFVALGELDWKEMLATRPNQPVMMRVLAAPGDHYAGAFADSRALLCIQLLSGTEADAPAIYGYIKRDSTEAREIEFSLQQAAELPLPLTLRLKYPADGASSNQAWVTEFVAASWMVPGRPVYSQAP